MRETALNQVRGSGRSRRREEPTQITEAGDSDCWHQIPPGNYSAVFVDDISDPRLWGGKRIARLRIVDGPDMDTVLRWYAQTPSRPGGRSKLELTYHRVVGQRPPRNILKVGLGTWLDERVLEIQVAYTKRDSQTKKDHTDQSQYSVVSEILGTLAGP